MLLLLLLFCLAEADDLRYEVKAMFQQLKSELEGQNADLASRLSASETKIEDLQTKLSVSETKIEDLQTKLQQLYQWCPNGWMKFADRCYYKTTEVKTWQEGRAECQSYGADLVTIDSSEEQAFIRGLKTGGYASWMGLSRSSTWAGWTWVRGTPLTTTYWGSGEPDHVEGRDCVLYKHNTDPGTWANQRCSNTFLSICEI